jgi:DNA polymerase-3 subunit gamma/tau
MARALAQPASDPTAQLAPQITLQSMDDVMRLIDARRDITLRLDLAKFARPVSFRPGAIAFEPAPGAPANLAQRLAQRLKEWTGQPWLVATEGGGGGESLLEREQRERLVVRREIEADPFIHSVMQAFPGAEIVAVRQLAVPEATGDVGEDED